MSTEARKNKETAKIQQKTWYDKGGRECSFQPGDQVLVPGAYNSSQTHRTMAGTLHCRGAGQESQLLAQDARSMKENCRISCQHVAIVAHADRDWAPGHGSTRGDRRYSILE